MSNLTLNYGYYSPINIGKFTPDDRIRALRSTAEWCRSGAPGGSPKQLFSSNGPCALGRALLDLHPVTVDWLNIANTGALSGVSELLVGPRPPAYSERYEVACRNIGEVAAYFDEGNLRQAAKCLESAAAAIEDMRDSPGRTEVKPPTPAQVSTYLQHFEAVSTHSKPWATLSSITCLYIDEATMNADSLVEERELVPA